MWSRFTGPSHQPGDDAKVPNEGMLLHGVRLANKQRHWSAILNKGVGSLQLANNLYSMPGTRGDNGKLNAAGRCRGTGNCSVLAYGDRYLCCELNQLNWLLFARNGHLSAQYLNCFNNRKTYHLYSSLTPNLKLKLRFNFRYDFTSVEKITSSPSGESKMFRLAWLIPKIGSYTKLSNVLIENILVSSLSKEEADR